jgi:hypothetical protein
MSEPKIVWIIQLTKEDKEFFDMVALNDGDKAYGNGARYVKRILENFRRDYQDVREEWVTQELALNAVKSFLGVLRKQSVRNFLMARLFLSDMLS